MKHYDAQPLDLMQFINTEHHDPCFQIAVSFFRCEAAAASLVRCSKDGKKKAERMPDALVQETESFYNIRFVKRTLMPGYTAEIKRKPLCAKKITHADYEQLFKCRNP